eukprot:TRINITY_DN572_c0_g1_i2.p1 TRINITY_DN572_c0_g1~~TRINITY_DN572_c0_g1_i2.p1  ORF type:complete len:507 (-),score=101.85 TRINITY_DN572_c0_g1_i2:88-1539(-)
MASKAPRIFNSVRVERKFTAPTRPDTPQHIVEHALDPTKGASTTLSYEQIQEGRWKHLSPSLSTFQAFQKPYFPVFGHFQYLWDHEGNQYLDLLAQNLTISVGHNHPHVVARAKEQMKKMVHCTTMYLNETPILAAQKLKETLPPGEDWVVHYVNSGSEAVDLAVMMSRVYTGSYDIISMRNAYHGLHSSAMDLTGLNVCKQNLPGSFGVKHVQNPDMYRGVFADRGNEAPELYARDVRDTITYSTSGKVAGFVFEKVQGYGGIHVLPHGYLQKATEYVREAGGLIIADEVQSGFGRMGKAFWSFELDGIVPDMIVTAKGLGNGFPVAAVMVKRKIAEAITHKQFFNTYGGNPLVTAASLGVLEALEKDKTQERALSVGAVFKTTLDNLKRDFPDDIGDVRGMGLMYGVELCKPNSTEPDRTKAAWVFEAMRDQGVIMGLGGLYKNVLRVMPPMAVSEEDAAFLDQVFRYALVSYRESHAVEI